MKASFFMFFYYLGLIGVPVLLLVVALLALLSVGGVVTTILLIAIGAGSIAYGAIALRECYFHGGQKSAAALKPGNQVH